MFVSRLEDFLKSNPSPATSLYMSLGSEENEKMTKAYRMAVEVFKRSSLENEKFKWKADFTEAANHGRNAYLSTATGLRWLFYDWRP